MRTAVCHPDRKHKAHGLCAECYRKAYQATERAKARRIAYARDNRERMATYQRAWAAANKDRVDAKQRRYRLKHAERRKLRRKELRLANIERAREYHRNWMAAKYAENPEAGRARAREYRKREPEIVRRIGRVRHANRRASLRGNPGIKPSPKDLQRVLEMTGGRCWYCGELVLDALTVDHVVPLCRGGSVGVDNLVPACPTCNFSKHHRLPAEWLSAKTDPRFAAARRRYGCPVEKAA